MSARKKLIFVVLVVLCLAAVGTTATLFGSTAAPGLTWNTPNVAPTVTAGSSATTTTITFTATGKLPDALVQISPAFAGLVTVSPSDLGTVRQGQAVTLTLTASAPASSTPVTIQGSIQIQKKSSPTEVYGVPLAISFHIIWPSASSDDMSITYPATWQLNQSALNLAHVVQLNNFSGAFMSGGILPGGGAQISFPSLLLTSTTLAQAIANDTFGDVVEDSEQVSVGGVSATKVTSEIQFGSALTYKRVAYYIPIGLTVHKAVLDYNLNDPQESTFVGQFDLMLSTLTFN